MPFCSSHPTVQENVVILFWETFPVRVIAFLRFYDIKKVSKGRGSNFTIKSNFPEKISCGFGFLIAKNPRGDHWEQKFRAGFRNRSDAQTELVLEDKKDKT